MMCRDWTRVRPFFAQEVGEQLSEGWGDTKSAYRVMQVYKYTICKKRKPVSPTVHHHSLPFRFFASREKRNSCSSLFCSLAFFFIPPIIKSHPPPPPPPFRPFFTYFSLFVFSHNYCVHYFFPSSRFFAASFCRSYVLIIFLDTEMSKQQIICFDLWK